MLTSINPLGERARGNHWWATVLPYLVASAVGGATTGAILGAIGALLGAVDVVPATAVRWIAAGALLAAAAADVAPWRVPGGVRQVDEAWLYRYRGWFYGAGYGWQLGTGVLTVVTSAATYALLVVLLLTGSPPAAAAIGAVFGLVRALPVLAVRRVTTPQQLRRMAGRLEVAARPAAVGTAATVALSGLLLGAGA